METHDKRESRHPPHLLRIFWQQPWNGLRSGGGLWRNCEACKRHDCDDEQRGCVVHGHGHGYTLEVDGELYLHTSRVEVDWLMDGTLLEVEDS